MIETFTTEPIATNSYLLYDNKSAAIIDCSFKSFERIKAFIENRQLVVEKIFITHSHWDHIADLHKFAQAYPVNIFVHHLDKENILNPGSDHLLSPLIIPGVKSIQQCTHLQKITVGKFEFTFLHTPGHSPGSICLYSEKENILFSGDTLFANGFGRVDLPTGCEEQMANSLIYLSKLPKDCTIYPGHGLSEKIGNLSFLKNLPQPKEEL